MNPIARPPITSRIGYGTRTSRATTASAATATSSPNTTSSMCSVATAAAIRRPLLSAIPYSGSHNSHYRALGFQPSGKGWMAIPWSHLAHSELVDGPRGELERQRWLCGPRDGQDEVGDRAVDGVVLGAVGIGVDPADEVLAVGADTALDGDVVAGQRERRAVGPLGTSVRRMAPSPPSRWRTPSSDRTPLATQGVVHGPTLIRPSAASSQASSRPSKPAPCSQIQRSACWAPQLCPTIPRQPVMSTTRPPARTSPSKRASGYGLSSFVRGSGARYMKSPGRWWNGGSDDSKRRSQAASRRSAPTSAAAFPTTRPGSKRASPTWMCRRARRRPRPSSS